MHHSFDVAASTIGVSNFVPSYNNKKFCFYPKKNNTVNKWVFSDKKVYSSFLSHLLTENYVREKCFVSKTFTAKV